MKRKRRPQPISAEPSREAAREGRLHGDSYADVSAREPDLGSTVSTHGGEVDRRAEEPSDPPVDAAEPLEGNLT